MILMKCLTALGKTIESKKKHFIMLAYNVSSIYESKFCNRYNDFAFDTTQGKLFLKINVEFVSKLYQASIAWPM